jgi:hypothetical protein
VYNVMPTHLQGAIGDCWFMSALAVLAEQPHLITNILLKSDEPGMREMMARAGVYQVRLCYNGEWCTTMVDDVLPCTRDGRIAYARAKGQQLWVSAAWSLMRILSIADHLSIAHIYRCIDLGRYPSSRKLSPSYMDVTRQSRLGL